MEYIDFSKAPDGSTHYAKDSRCPLGIQWYLLEAGKPYKFWFHGKNSYWEIGAGNCEEPAVEFSPVPSGWNGSGLPPAGAVCVLRTKRDEPDGGWMDAEIMYSSKSAVVWRWEGRTEEFGSEWREVEIRPIRTPEQIATEQRDAAAHAMSNVTAGAKDWMEAFRMLHDAGLRFKERP